MHYPRHQGSYFMKKGTWFPSLYSSPSIPCSQRPLELSGLLFSLPGMLYLFSFLPIPRKPPKTQQTRYQHTQTLLLVSAPSSPFIWPRFIVQLHHSSRALVKGWAHISPPMQVDEPRCNCIHL